MDSDENSTSNLPRSKKNSLEQSEVTNSVIANPTALKTEIPPAGNSPNMAPDEDLPSVENYEPRNSTLNTPSVANETTCPPDENNKADASTQLVCDKDGHDASDIPPEFRLKPMSEQIETARKEAKSFVIIEVKHEKSEDGKSEKEHIYFRMEADINPPLIAQQEELLRNKRVAAEAAKALSAPVPRPVYRIKRRKARTTVSQPIVEEKIIEEEPKPKKKKSGKKGVKSGSSKQDVKSVKGSNLKKSGMNRAEDKKKGVKVGGKTVVKSTKSGGLSKPGAAKVGGIKSVAKPGTKVIAAKPGAKKTPDPKSGAKGLIKPGTKPEVKTQKAGAVKLPGAKGLSKQVAAPQGKFAARGAVKGVTKPVGKSTPAPARSSAKGAARPTTRGAVRGATIGGKSTPAPARSATKGTTRPTTRGAVNTTSRTGAKSAVPTKPGAKGATKSAPAKSTTKLAPKVAAKPAGAKPGAKSTGVSKVQAQKADSKGSKGPVNTATKGKQQASLLSETRLVKSGSTKPGSTKPVPKGPLSSKSSKPSVIKGPKQGPLKREEKVKPNLGLMRAEPKKKPAEKPALGKTASKPIAAKQMAPKEGPRKPVSKNTDQVISRKPGVKDVRKQDGKIRDVKKEGGKIKDVKKQDGKIKDMKKQDVKKQDVKKQDVKKQDGKIKDTKKQDGKIKDVKKQDGKVKEITTKKPEIKSVQKIPTKSINNKAVTFSPQEKLTGDEKEVPVIDEEMSQSETNVSEQERDEAVDFESIGTKKDSVPSDEASSAEKPRVLGDEVGLRQDEETADRRAVVDQSRVLEAEEGLEQDEGTVDRGAVIEKPRVLEATTMELDKEPADDQAVTEEYCLLNQDSVCASGTAAVVEESSSLEHHPVLAGEGTEETTNIGPVEESTPVEMVESSAQSPQTADMSPENEIKLRDEVKQVKFNIFDLLLKDMLSVSQQAASIDKGGKGAVRIREEEAKPQTPKTYMCDVCGYRVTEYLETEKGEGEEPAAHETCKECGLSVIKETPSREDCINCRGELGRLTKFELRFDMANKVFVPYCTLCQGPLQWLQRGRRHPPAPLGPSRGYPSAAFTDMVRRWEPPAGDGWLRDVISFGAQFGAPMVSQRPPFLHVTGYSQEFKPPPSASKPEKFFGRRKFSGLGYVK